MTPGENILYLQNKIGKLENRKNGEQEVIRALMCQINERELNIAQAKIRLIEIELEISMFRKALEISIIRKEIEEERAKLKPT